MEAGSLTEREAEVAGELVETDLVGLNAEQARVVVKILDGEDWPDLLDLDDDEQQTFDGLRQKLEGE